MQQNNEVPTQNVPLQTKKNFLNYDNNNHTGNLTFWHMHIKIRPHQILLALVWDMSTKEGKFR